MAMKGYSTFSKSLNWSLAIRMFNVISRTLVGVVLLLFRDVVRIFNAKSILQPQPTGLTRNKISQLNILTFVTHYHFLKKKQFRFFRLTKNDTVLPQQKYSAMAFLSWWGLEPFERPSYLKVTFLYANNSCLKGTEDMLVKKIKSTHVYFKMVSYFLLRSGPITFSQ